MKRMFSMLMAVAATTIFMAGCDEGSGQQALGDLAANQKIAESCPKDRVLATYVADDLSGTGRDDGIAGNRLAVIQDLVRRTAVCSGHLHVTAFSSSAAATVTVFDGDLRPPGATDIARLRKVPDLVAATLRPVADGLVHAEQQLPADGSDIIAQVGLAKEYVDQLSGGDGSHQLSLELLTDGVQTTGVVLNTDLSSATAMDMAHRVWTPSLPAGSSFKIAGLGKVAGPPPSTTYIDALKTFYLTYCQRTGASCEAVTDYTSGS